jgi:hypothetical protein
MSIGAFKQDVFPAHGHKIINLLSGQIFDMGVIRNNPGIPPIGDGMSFALQSAIFADSGSYMNMAIWQATAIQNLTLRTGMETAPASVSFYFCIKY